MSSEDRPPLPRTATPASSSQQVARRVASVVDSAVEGAATVVQGAVDAVQAAARRWDDRPGARVRRLRRRARHPLPSLYVLHPEARRAVPHEIGLKSIDVDEIRGTAVAGATQRGGDFLPLRPFRSKNWVARWQRLRSAMARLVILPPIDVVRYDGAYWVLDGHNRVAGALYDGQVAIDAHVVELVPRGGALTERPASLAPSLTGTRALRAAGRGERVGSDLDEQLAHGQGGVARPGRSGGLRGPGEA